MKSTYSLLQSNIVPLLVGLLLRLINIQSPIVGVHSWRQADTAAMARHFALNGTPIWLPQIDWSGATQGYVESEFPLFPYLVAQLYKLSGIDESIGRGISITFSLFTIYLVIKIGTFIFDKSSGWWGGFFFALLPLNVYYGRTFQAESLLMFLASLSIYSALKWKKSSSFLWVFICWVSFTLSCLIKVLPFVWLGLPLLIINKYKKGRRFWQIIYSSCQSVGFWLFSIGSILIIFIWFSYAYRLGQSTNLSFLIWGTDSGRHSIKMLFDLRQWLDLFIRIVLRNLSLFGLPLLLIGYNKKTEDGLNLILNSGLFGVLFCTLLAIKSSSVHEYYQLPLQIFVCPLMGRGWVDLRSVIPFSWNLKIFKTIIILLITCISLTILFVDYFSLERKQELVWMPLAQEIRSKVDPDWKIVSVTGPDPTLLNLSRRQGWLTTAKNVNQVSINHWINQGATHLVGSLKWDRTYLPLETDESRSFSSQLKCDRDFDVCPAPPNYTYLIRLNILQ